MKKLLVLPAILAMASFSGAASAQSLGNFIGGSLGGQPDASQIISGIQSGLGNIGGGTTLPGGGVLPAPGGTGSGGGGTTPPVGVEGWTLPLGIGSTGNFLP